MYELIGDNTTFSSDTFKVFMEKWFVQKCFRCTHVSSRNGIEGRCQRAIKRIVA